MIPTDHEVVNKRNQLENEKLKKKIDKMEKAEEKEIIELYREALEDIQLEVLRYENKGLLTITAILAYNRLVNLEKRIVEEVSDLNKGVRGNIKAYTANVYLQKYEGMQNLYSRALGVEGLRFPKLDNNLVKAATKNTLDRIGWEARLLDIHARLSKTIRQELYSAINSGKSYTDIAKMLQEKLEIGATQAMRIARTEGHRIVEQATLDAMMVAEKLGVKQKKRWLATLDDRTRDIHQELDGVTIPINDYFTDGHGGRGLAPGQMGVASSDINCRCDLATIIEGFEPTTRIARDAKGKNIKIPYMNYKEWDD